MKIVTWNVNSIKARLPGVTQWLKETSPDVVLLQELKCQTEAFPYLEIEELGYNLAIHGQKTYNGVAILSKHPVEDMITSIPGNEADENARYVEGVISVGKNAVRVASVYVPNGQEVGSDKFAYKLNFLDHLHAHVKTLLGYDEAFVIGGDYNVAPFDLDVHAPNALYGTLCFHPDEQKRLRSLLNIGLVDAFRLRQPEASRYSWWDYRAGCYEQNKGMRIDHLLLSPKAADLLEECDIDETPRGREKASDHAPVWCRLAA